MGKTLVITKVIHVPNGWDDGLWQRAIAFWQEREFRFTERCGQAQTGKRGSLWGNLTAFNPMKLRTVLTVTRLELTRVEFRMEIDTTAQVITEWNEEHLHMEMETLETWLLEGDKKETEWRAFYERCRKADRDWIINHPAWYGAWGVYRVPPKK